MRSFGSAAFLTIITLTSVGYGDVIPCTRYGRFLMAVVALWGAFLLSLLVAVISNAFYI